MIGTVWTVWCKELRDALRDRRTLLAMVLSSVAIGPLVLVLLSALVAGIEQRAQARELMVEGIAHAPTLHNFLLRNNVRVDTAPPRFEQQLRSKQLGEPVLVIAADFETVLARGEPPRVALIFNSANPRAAAGAARVERLLQGFAQESLRGSHLNHWHLGRQHHREAFGHRHQSPERYASYPFRCRTGRPWRRSNRSWP